MKKQLKFEPIYKGMCNMTPNNYAAMKKAEAYSEVCARRDQLRLSNVELVIMLLSVSYLVLSIVR